MLKYIAKTGNLYSEKRGLLKEVKCPLEKEWNELQRVNSEIERALQIFEGRDDLVKKVISKERHRYCDSCRSMVMSLDGLSEDEIAGACLADKDLCLHATLPHPAIEVEADPDQTRRCLYHDTELRLIHTARHLTAMNYAVKEGCWPLIRPVIPDESIGTKIQVWQDEYGKIEVSSDFRGMRPGGSEIYWHNPYISPLPFAAYLVPPDIEPDERVLLVDLIEDIPGVEWNQGDSWRQKSGEATWTGEDFEIDDIGPMMILG